MPECKNCENSVYLHEYESYFCRKHKQPVRSDDICDDWGEKNNEV